MFDTLLFEVSLCHALYYEDKETDFKIVVVRIHSTELKKTHYLILAHSKKGQEFEKHFNFRLNCKILIKFLRKRDLPRLCF